MKKTVYILLLLPFLTCCVIESYDKPKKTVAGYHLASYATGAMCTNALFADVARVIRMWQEAPTHEERYKIEDKYFRNQKVREIGDTIQIVGICKINTFGKSFADSYWEIFSSVPHSGIEQKVSLSGDGIRVERIDKKSAEKCDLVVDFTGDGKEYSVTGTGRFPVIPRYDGGYTGGSYNITAPVKLVSVGELSPFWFYGRLEVCGGDLAIKVYRDDIHIEQDDISVRYLPGPAIKVSFRGFNDYFDYFHWNWLWRY